MPKKNEKAFNQEKKHAKEQFDKAGIPKTSPQRKNFMRDLFKRHGREFDKRKPR